MSLSQMLQMAPEQAWAVTKGLAVALISALGLWAGATLIEVEKKAERAEVERIRSDVRVLQERVLTKDEFHEEMRDLRKTIKEDHQRLRESIKEDKGG